MSGMSADDWCKPDNTNAWNNNQPRLNILLKYMLERTVVPLKDGSSAILDADHKDLLKDLEAVQKGQLKCDSSRGQSFRGYYMGWKGTKASKDVEPLIAIDPFSIINFLYFFDKLKSIYQDFPTKFISNTFEVVST